MRVLVASTFASPHVGGVERYVDWLRSALEERGHEVRLVAATHPAHADLVLPSFSPGSGAVSTVPVAFAGPRHLRELRRLVAWSDVILIQNCFYTLSLLVALVAASQGKPARTIVHANSNSIPGMGFVSRALSGGYAHTLGAWQLHLAPPWPVSESGARFLIDAYGVSGEVLRFPLSTLPQRAALAGPEKEGAARIVWAGRLVAAKAPDVAIRAVGVVARRRPVEFHLYGDGPLSSGLGDAPWLTYHGSRPWEEVVTAQCTAHIFLSTSIADNVQTSLLEAVAMGVPSVATRVGEAPQYLRGDLARLIGPINDPVGLARVLEDAIGSWDHLNTAAGLVGQQLQAEHNPGECADQLERLLGDVRSGGRRMPAGGRHR